MLAVPQAGSRAQDMDRAFPRQVVVDLHDKHRVIYRTCNGSGCVADSCIVTNSRCELTPEKQAKLLESFRSHPPKAKSTRKSADNVICRMQEKDSRSDDGPSGKSVAEPQEGRTFEPGCGGLAGVMPAVALIGVAAACLLLLALYASWRRGREAAARRSAPLQLEPHATGATSPEQPKPHVHAHGGSTAASPALASSSIASRSIQRPMDWLDSHTPSTAQGASTQPFYRAMAGAVSKRLQTLRKEPGSVGTVQDSPLVADTLLSSGTASCSPQHTGIADWHMGLPGTGTPSLAHASMNGCAQLLRSCRTPYVSKLNVQTVHIKVPFIEPEQLPPDFLQTIQTNLMTHTNDKLTILSAAVRRGCVELALDVMTTRRMVAMATAAQPQPQRGRDPACGPPTGRERSSSSDISEAVGALAVSRRPQSGKGLAAGKGAGAAGAGWDEGDWEGAEASGALHQLKDVNGDSSSGGMFSQADLEGLTPLDWVHWLYLQPPSEAEVLVQACGRAFITCWDATNQHWLTQELATSVDQDGNRLPDSLPRVSHVDPPCVALPDPQSHAGHHAPTVPAWDQPYLGDDLLGLHLPQEPAGSKGMADAPPPLQLLLVGQNLHHARATVAARFHGAYLRVESRPLYATEQGAMPIAAELGLPGVGCVGSRNTVSWLGQLQDSMQVLEVLVHGVACPGLLQLEGWCARLLAWRWQVAVVPSSTVAAELSQHFSAAGLQPLLLSNQPGRQLHTAGGSVGGASSSSGAAGLQNTGQFYGADAAAGPESDQLKVDDLMTDLGCWLEFAAAMRALGLSLSCFNPSRPLSRCGSGSVWQPPQITWPQAVGVATRQPALPLVEKNAILPELSDALKQACRSVLYQEQMMDTAVQLLGHSCGAAWPAAAGMLLDGLLSLGLEWQTVRERSTQHSLTLLHRAVCSGSTAMVQLVVEWGEKLGQPWMWGEADPGSGITPLHLAAMLPAGSGFHHSLHASQLLSTGELTVGGPGSSTKSTLADWILAEFDAAWRFWHGAADTQGVTPAEVADAVGRIGQQALTTGGGVVDSSRTGSERSGHPGPDGNDQALSLGSWSCDGRLNRHLGASASGTSDGGNGAGGRGVGRTQHTSTADWVSLSQAVSRRLSSNSFDATFGLVAPGIQNGEGTAHLAAGAGPGLTGWAQTLSSGRPGTPGAQSILDQHRFRCSRSLDLSSVHVDSLAAGKHTHQAPLSCATGWQQGQAGTTPTWAANRAVDSWRQAATSTVHAECRTSACGCHVLLDGTQVRVCPAHAAAPKLRGGLVGHAAATAASRPVGVADEWDRPAFTYARPGISSGGLLDSDHLVTTAVASGEPGSNPTTEVQLCLSPAIDTIQPPERHPTFSDTWASQPPGASQPAAAVAAAASKAPNFAVAASSQPANGLTVSSSKSAATAAAASSSTAAAHPLASSKQLSRLDADLQLIQAALTPKALLQASCMQFPSTRLEDGFVIWLSAKRESARPILTACMACMVGAACVQEFMKGGDYRGFVTLLLFLAPWLVLLSQRMGKRGRAVHAGSAERDEQTWVAVILWHLLVRGLQGANLLVVPLGCRTFVNMGGDAVSEGAVQVFFLIRAQRFALLRVLYTLSAVAIYLRGGVPIGPAFLRATVGNGACLLAAWLLDLANRRSFLQHLASVLRQQQQQLAGTAASGSARQGMEAAQKAAPALR